MIDTEWWTLILILSIGFSSGLLGAMLGVGGGFLAVPMMGIMLGLSPQTMVGASITMSFLNALSGTAYHWDRQRVDFSAGWRLAMATIPGSIGGAFIAGSFTNQSFNLAFGGLLVLVAALMWFRQDPSTDFGFWNNWTKRISLPGSWGVAEARIVDRWGVVHEYSYNRWLGVCLSFLIGFVSSSLGIGGGIIHVPLLVILLRFPPHIATATSLFILSISALVGTISHLALGHTELAIAVPLSGAGIVGAQFGVRIASRIEAEKLVRYFAIAMLFVAVRLIWNSR